MRQGKTAMQALKVIGLGLLFSIVGTIGLLILGIAIGILRGPVSTNHATGLSAVFAGLKEATIFNPVYWIVIAVAFGLAFGKCRGPNPMYRVHFLFRGLHEKTSFWFAGLRRVSLFPY